MDVFGCGDKSHCLVTLVHFRSLRQISKNKEETSRAGKNCSVQYIGQLFRPEGQPATRWLTTEVGSRSVDDMFFHEIFYFSFGWIKSLLQTRKQHGLNSGISVSQKHILTIQLLAGPQDLYFPTKKKKVWQLSFSFWWGPKSHSETCTFSTKLICLLASPINNISKSCVWQAWYC